MTSKQLSFVIQGDNPKMPKKKIKIGLISVEYIGKKMAGPGIRYFEMAKVLSNSFSVTLFAPNRCDIKSKQFKTITYRQKFLTTFSTSTLRNFDYIIAQNLSPLMISKLKRLGIRFIADLYDPLPIEALEYAKDDKKRLRDSLLSFNNYNFLLQLDLADHILCSSPAQKDLYLGMLTAKNKITFQRYLSSPKFDKFISIFSFGMDKTPPKSKQKNILSEQFPQISKNDKIVYWGGGIWNWFDSLSVVKAIEKISKKRNDIKLFFLGVTHPNPKIKKMAMATKTIDYCKKHKLIDRFVFFNNGWTPYNERSNYLLDADIAISTHFDNLETRFSFRTRVLDYFWAELPMVLTRGDYMAKLAHEHHLGQNVREKDIDGIVRAILKLADDKDEYQICKNNINKIKSSFYWENCAGELTAKISQDKISLQKPFPIKFTGQWIKYYTLGAIKKLAKYL